MTEKKKLAPIEVGDRFETRDTRDTGRVVEVIELLNLDEESRRRIEYLNRPDAKPPFWAFSIADAIEYHRLSGTKYRIRTEVHPRNPSAEGTSRVANERTLRTKYRRVSR